MDVHGIGLLTRKYELNLFWPILKCYEILGCPHFHSLARIKMFDRQWECHTFRTTNPYCEEDFSGKGCNRIPSTSKSSIQTSRCRRSFTNSRDFGQSQTWSKSSSISALCNSEVFPKLKLLLVLKPHSDVRNSLRKTFSISMCLCVV